MAKKIEIAPEEEKELENEITTPEKVSLTAKQLQEKEVRIKELEIENAEIEKEKLRAEGERDSLMGTLEKLKSKVEKEDLLGLKEIHKQFWGGK